MFILNWVSRKLLAIAGHFLESPLFFFQKALSGYQVFSTISDPKNTWWPPCAFYDFQPRKRLATMRRFVQIFIEKKPSSLKVFS